MLHQKLKRKVGKASKAKGKAKASATVERETQKKIKGTSKNVDHEMKICLMLQNSANFLCL